MNDLFGQPVLGNLPSRRWRRPLWKQAGRPQGYAAAPGSGPTGETCGTCAHCRRVGYGHHNYFKCNLVHPWTGSYGTDILKKSPACEHFQSHD